MAVEGSDQILYLRTTLEWLDKNSKLKNWMFYTHQVRDLGRELRLAYRIFRLLEIFLLPRGDDETLKSFLDNMVESVHEKGMAIHGAIQEVSHQGSEVSDYTKYQFLFSTFLDAAKIIEPLFGITVEKYNHSSSHRSKHCSMDQLLKSISLVSEDSSMEEEEKVKYKLQFMKDFIRFAASRGVPKYMLNELLVQGEFMVTTATYYSYMHQIPYEITDKATSKVIETRYSEILRLPPKVRKIYVRVLKATRSSSPSSSQTIAGDDVDVIVTFMDSLVENHLELLASDSSFTVSVIKIIVEEMRFWKNFLLYKKRSKDGTVCDDHDRNLVTRTIDLIVEAGILLYSHSWHDDGDDLKLKEEELIKDAAAELGFSNWMENVEVFKRDVGMKYPETSRYKFPRTNELGFIDGLLEDLKQFMIRENNRELIMDHHQEVLEDLVFLRDFLRKIVRLRHENGDLNALWIRVVEVAYRIEFMVNSMEVGDSSVDCTPASFSTIKEEIKKIKFKVEEIYAEEEKKKKGCQEIENDSNNLPSRSSSSSNSNSNSTPTMDEFMVGFEDEVKKIIDRIEAKYSNLDIVPIVGMAGQGKTTLAKKVYNDLNSQGKTTLAKKVYDQFQIFAWCCISQGYQRQKWLLDILRGTLGYKVVPSAYETRTEGDLEKDVYQSLKGKRYLIVLDDIWETEAWRGLKSCFPDDNNGSRILLTTRIRDVAGGGGGTDHVLRFLNDQESWELLRKKLFPKNEACSEEKERIGTRIAESCKGLPFAVVMVAGILGAMEKDEEWEDFAKGLSISRTLESEKGSEMVELSYVHLPEYLKPCLLYFGAFLQDQVIPVSRLTWLWSAEGFVQQQQQKETDKNESSSSENVAKEYLMDLIKRSLVMAVNKTSRGGIKSCSIHDLVHQFCITKAKEENFQQKLNLNLPGELRAALPEPRRLCIYSERKYFSKVRLTFRRLSSLILFPLGRSHEFYDVSSNFRHFKLLRVLDLRGFICRSFPPGIEKLVQLRYLALVGEITSIPSTIIKLLNLETFLLKGIRGEITLPRNLLNLTKLRHLHVNNRVVFGLSPEEDQNLESCNLESFCTLRLSSSGQEIVKNIIKKIKNIRKLKCSFFGSWDSKEGGGGGCQIPTELSILTKLESLKVHSIGRVSYPLKFSFPVKLKKLTLCNFYLPWEKISELAKLLPNLEVLKLLSKACEGETWDMGEEEVFSNLQFLKLENLDIVHWNAHSENFPRIQVLILSRCNKLEEIPMEMEEIDTLKVIEVKWCKESAATSAQALQEAIEGLEVSTRVQESEDKPATED